MKIFTQFARSKVFTLLLSTFLIMNNLNSQPPCLGVINNSASSICLGDSVFLQASNPFHNLLETTDFNSSSLPSGWSSSGTTSFSSPCGPSLNNTPYYWASTATLGTFPGITTGGINLSQGGFINFEMIFAEQGGPAPCEGPDQYNEGLSVQYSLDGGATWIDIVYYAPNGAILPSNPNVTSPGVSGPTPFTTWNTITVTIPTAAWSTNTMFRWIQLVTSGSCCDNWGLDNISIYSPVNASGNVLPSITNWSNGILDTSSFYLQPTTDTSIVAYFYDTLGVFQCQSDTLKIKVFNGGFSYSLPDTVFSYCPTVTTPVSVTNLSAEALFPISYSWSNGDTSNLTNLQSPGYTPSHTWYNVNITDACGYSYTDSVLLNVNQTLSISQFNVTPQMNCLPNGSLSGVVVGNQGPITYVWTNAAGQIMNPFSNNATNLTSGWYKLTVTDNVCNTEDTVFVQQIISNNITFDLTADTTVSCPGSSVVLFASNLAGNTGTATYSWSNGSSLTFINATTTGALNEVLTYYLTITDFCGNSHTDSTIITVAIDSATQMVTSCGPYTWRNGVTYTSSNSTASYMVINSTGCDSIIFLDLTIFPTISQTISNNANILSTNYSSPTANYQWIDCAHPNNILVGETNSSFAPQSIGLYAVVTTDNQCSDTSSCELVADLGLNSSNLNTSFQLFPNPNNGAFTISVSEHTGSTPISIFNSVGQLIYQSEIDSDKIEINLSLASGVYIVKVDDQQIRMVIN
jgi:hypothetical protein